MTSDYTEVDKMPEVDTSELKEHKLPPHPKGIREWQETDKRYNGDMCDYNKRIAHKLYKMWCSWASIVMNERINKALTEECDQSSPLFDARCDLIDIMDVIGKDLSDTNILEELAWLTTDDQKKFVTDAKQKLSEKSD